MYRLINNSLSLFFGKLTSNSKLHNSFNNHWCDMITDFCFQYSVCWCYSKDWYRVISGDQFDQEIRPYYTTANIDMSREKWWQNNTFIVSWNWLDLNALSHDIFYERKMAYLLTTILVRDACWSCWTMSRFPRFHDRYCE